MPGEESAKRTPATSPSSTGEERRPDFPWSYKGELGSENWPKFFTSCNGNRQSPVNIVHAVPSPELTAIQIIYPATAARVVHDGFTARFEFPTGCVMNVNGKRYDLIQLHFHAPSEHTLEGKRFSMEAHLVHKEIHTKQIAVVGVFLRPGTRESAMDRVWKQIPSQANEEKAIEKVDISELLGLSKEIAVEYYAYEGSLTTPPCTEGVQWFLLKNPSEIPAQNLAGYHRQFPPNARPVQPLNGRMIQASIPD